MDKDEISVDVDHTILKFIDLARQLEAFFLQKRFLLSALKPESVVKEDINDLRAELNRKDELIKRHYEKISAWQTLLADLQVQSWAKSPAQGSSNTPLAGTPTGAPTSSPNIPPPQNLTPNMQQQLQQQHLQQQQQHQQQQQQHVQQQGNQQIHTQQQSYQQMHHQPQQPPQQQKPLKGIPAVVPDFVIPNNKESPTQPQTSSTFLPQVLQNLNDQV